MKKVILLSYFLLLLMVSKVFSQGVAINDDNSSPNASAMLDVKSTTKGLLIPRMTETDRNNISSPATGLMIFQTNATSGFYYYTGSTWSLIGGGSTPTFSTTSNVTSNAGGTYTTDDFVFGSPQLSESTNTNHDERFFFDKSKGAFRAGYEPSDRWDDSNVGVNSIGLGNSTTASGNNSFASGNVSVASGFTSTAMGSGTVASGRYTNALGLGTEAPSYAEVAVGTYNTTYTPNDADAFNSADRLFVVGNGTGNASRSDALIVFKNGTITGQTLSLNSSNTAPVTSAILDISSTSKGLLIPRMTGAERGSISSPATGLMVFQTDATSGFYYYTGSAWSQISGTAFTTTSNITSNTTGDYTADDFVFGSPQLSESTNTNHDERFFFDKSKGAFRAGYEPSDRWDDSNVGVNSIGLGNSTTASGNNSFASGNVSVASGFTSTAMGSGTVASGRYTNALGLGTEAPSYAEVAVGTYNTTYTPNDADAFNSADRLFVVGNGTGNASRSDALIVFKTGNATLQGDMTANGVTLTSDRRFKTNITRLDNSLSNIMKLNGYSYFWKDKTKRGDKKQIGVIAQEIEELYPELVKKDQNGYLSVNYSGLVPVLMEALKEQQTQIEALKGENSKLKTKMGELDQLKAEIEQIKTLIGQQELADNE